MPTQETEVNRLISVAANGHGANGAGAGSETPAVTVPEDRLEPPN